jgi:hypothetical protein
MHAIAALATETAKKRRYLEKGLKEQLSFLGEDNIANRSAVENLMTMAPNRYVYAGSELDLSKVIPGVKVHGSAHPRCVRKRGSPASAAKIPTNSGISRPIPSACRDRARLPPSPCSRLT